jgi:hypothetical protein
MRGTCLFAHFDPSGRFAGHVLHYLREIRRAGFDLLVISAGGLRPGEEANITSLGGRVLQRENAGFDFGSWADGLKLVAGPDGYPAISGYLLLANDSVYGPLGDLSAALGRLLALPGDVHGMVESLERTPHLQSWFLLMAPTVYRHPLFRETFDRDFARLPKSEIIRQGEIGFSVRCRAAGFRLAALAPGGMPALARFRIPFNPALTLWHQIVEQDGVPFIKVELLKRNPALIAGASDWRSLAARRAPALTDLMRVDIGEAPDPADPERVRRYLVPPALQEAPIGGWREKFLRLLAAWSRPAIALRDRLIVYNDRKVRGGGRIGAVSSLLLYSLLYRSAVLVRAALIPKSAGGKAGASG